MSIRLGVYDFFSYTLPGSVYIITFLCFAIIEDIHFHSLFFEGFGIGSLLILGIFAYFLGFLTHPLADLVWKAVYCREDLEDEALRYARKNFGGDDFFKGLHHGVCLERIRLHSQESADRIDKHSADRIMLVNLSFALLVAAITASIFVILYEYDISYAAFIPALLVLSLISLKLSNKFGVWYFVLIFQAWKALCDDRKSKPDLDGSKSEVHDNSG